MKRVLLAVQLVVLGVSVLPAQDDNSIVLSPECFDTLPYGVERSCEGRFIKKRKVRLANLYSVAANRILADSLIITGRDSADTGVLVLAAPQPAKGHCAVHGPAQWKQPTVAVRFQATPKKKETTWLMLVRSTVVAEEGRAAGALSLTICYLSHYLGALDSVPPLE